MTALGVYIGHDPYELRKFENWLGREVDFVRGHGNRASWEKNHGSIDYVIRKLGDTGRDIYWSIPLIPNDASLSRGANGEYDHHYRSMAQKLAKHHADDSEIYVRTGEEFNGRWFPWSAIGRPQEFIDAYRNFVDAFRSVSDKFVFEWNVHIGGRSMDPATAYPGDRYVDVIGMDFYYDKRWDSPDAATAWKEAVNEPYGLKWLEDFADARGKPTGYSEWGIDYANAGDYVKNVAKWFADNDVLYQSYWNTNSGFAGKLSDGRTGNTDEVFQQTFRVATDSSAPAPSTPAAPAPSQPSQPSEPTQGSGADLDVWMIDTRTGQKLVKLEDGSAIGNWVLAGREITIAAFVFENSRWSDHVDYAELDLDDGAVTRREKIEPYALFGDDAWTGRYLGGTSFSKGAHEMSIALHSDGSRGLPSSETFEFDFDVV